jgi:RNA polymerase sigma factor (sigma-70 family)
VFGLRGRIRAVRPGVSSTLDHVEVAELVRLAVARDQAAWNELVRRYAPVVWRVTAAHRLSRQDAKDVSQNTWFALAERLPAMREPGRVAAWLATTARRECLRLHAMRQHERGREWFDVEETATDRCPEPHALRNARDRLLWQAFDALSERCRRLLGLIAHAPELTYAQVAQLLRVNTGGIGASRNRCLHELRRQLAVLGVEGTAG